jgi:hypothetical protein
MTTGKISSIGAEDNGFAVQEQEQELAVGQPAKQAKAVLTYVDIYMYRYLVLLELLL